MNDIIEMRPRIPPSGPKQPKSKIEDDWILKLCATWRMERAQQQKNWAAHELATRWGTLDSKDIKLDTGPLGRMQEIEHHLANLTPCTMLCAREMLGMGVTILAHAGEDPESTLANGPVLDIVRNVIQSLDYCKAEMSIGPKRRDRAND
jgi:hypothetical protein